MGKKTRFREFEEFELVKWYQWEFLRRNPEYRKDVEAFLANFGTWFADKGFWYDEDAVYRGKDLDFFDLEICPRAAEICRKWQISDPFSPDWDFDRDTGLYEYKPGLFDYLPTGISAEHAADGWSPDRTTWAALMREAKKKRSSPKPDLPYVTVRLNMTQPKKTLLERVNREIDFGKARYEKFLKRSGKVRDRAPKMRRRLELYDRYLRVWDLRQQGLSFPRIAERVYPKDYLEETARYKERRREGGTLPVVQKMMDHLRRAATFIDNGYKEIE